MIKTCVTCGKVVDTENDPFWYVDEEDGEEVECLDCGLTPEQEEPRILGERDSR